METFDAKRLLPAMREIVSEGIRVHGALPNPDASYLLDMSSSGLASQIIHDASQAYGWDSVRIKWVPTAREIARSDTVMTWLAALRQQPDGKADLRRLTAIAYGVPLHVIADRERVAEKTVRRHADLSLCWIMGEFLAMPCDPGKDEPEEQGPPNTIKGWRDGSEQHFTEQPTEPGKVYIGGIGWFYKGRRWNEGGAKLNRLERAS